MAQRVRSATGSATTTTTVGSLDLRVTRLSGTQGFSSNSRVYGFASTSASASQAPATTGSYTTTQTRTATRTATRPATYQHAPTVTSTKPAPSARTRAASSSRTSLRQWLKRIFSSERTTPKSGSAGETSNAASKSKPVVSAPVTTTHGQNQLRQGTKARTEGGGTQTSAGMQSDASIDPGHSHTEADATGTGTGTQQGLGTTKQRFNTIFTVASGAPDPGDPRGSSTVTATDDADGYENKGKDDAKDDLGLDRPKKRHGRVNTIWDVKTAAAGGPGDPPSGKSTSAHHAVHDDYDSISDGRLHANTTSGRTTAAKKKKRRRFFSNLPSCRG